MPGYQCAQIRIQSGSPTEGQKDTGTFTYSWYKYAKNQKVFTMADRKEGRMRKGSFLQTKKRYYSHNNDICV